MEVISIDRLEGMSERSIWEISKLKYIRSLNFGGCEQISPLVIQIIISSCDALETLNLKQCFGLSANTFPRSGHPLLRKLEIFGCSKLNESEVSEFISRCPNLLSLDISRCHQFEGEVIDAILNSKIHLKTFYSIACSKISSLHITRLLDVIFIVFHLNTSFLKILKIWTSLICLW